MEDQKEEENQERNEKRRKNIIQIPSYEEVFNINETNNKKSEPKPYNPPLPPPSFSQAFSFIKSSEFYTPPPQIKEPRPIEETQSSNSASASTSNYNNAAAQNRNAILVSHRQKGNPLLKHIRNVRWIFADIVADYLLGQSSCALYLSLRYHLLHPDYLYFRIRELQKKFKLCVVLCHVDVEDVIKPLLEVTKTALLHDCTLLCGWRPWCMTGQKRSNKRTHLRLIFYHHLSLFLEECGRYLETIKVYENKSSDLIREQTDTDYLSRLTHALTAIRRVNKTDVVTLGSAFGSLSRIMDASMEDLARCPGIGERKVKRLHDTFHEPFRRVSNQPTVPAPETPSKNHSIVEESPLVEDCGVVKENKNQDSSEAKKDATLNVKSALSAAFAKYADRIQKPERNNSLEKGEGSGGRTMASDD